MLVALVLTLESTVTATLPAFLGQAVHAWFLDEVRRDAPQFARALHDEGSPKPFTVSSLWSPPARLSRDTLHLSRGQPAHFRVTGLEPVLSHYLHQTFAPRLCSDVVHLCGVPFRVRDVAASGECLGASQTSYEDIADRAVQSPPPTSITLRFVSPTIFRRTPPRDAPFGDDSYNVPFPLPELVFGGLLDVWNAFAPEPISAEMRDFFRDCVAVSRHSLHTELVTFSGGRRGRVGGFVGTCRYAFNCQDAQARRCVGMLAALAPFAGVGLRTTMGLGQVDYCEKPLLRRR
jgi:CRISPR-associated endoribonuclease Cas6